MPIGLSVQLSQVRADNRTKAWEIVDLFPAYLHLDVAQTIVACDKEGSFHEGAATLRAIVESGVFTYEHIRLVVGEQPSVQLRKSA